MNDLEARRRMARHVVDWLDGRLPVDEFISNYWQTRRELLGSNWTAFEGAFGEMMSAVDTAVDSYRADDRADFEIDERQLAAELRAVVDRLSDLMPEVLQP